MLKFSGGGIVPGVSRAEHVTGDNQLPQEVEVVVIGGGLEFGYSSSGHCHFPIIERTYPESSVMLCSYKMSTKIE